MIGRRVVLLAGPTMLARRASAAMLIAHTDNLTFRLIRNGSEIGHHSVTFETTKDTLTVHVAVDALVSLFSIPIVHYRHRVSETWQAGTLVGLVGETDKNGQRGWVHAQRTIEGLEVQGSKTARYIAPESAIGTSYWNKRMLNGPMISLEDGALLRPKVTEKKAEAIRLASGSTIAADHYNLSGAFAVDVWYDESNAWAGLAFSVADGSYVHYERL